MGGSRRLVWYLSHGTFRYIVAAVSRTPYRRQRPRTGWSAALSAAAAWPRRWFTVRRLVWLLCIGFSLFVIWGAGTHLGPGLRAAHGQGIPGQWIAQQQDSGAWSGEFVSSSGTVTLQNVSYAGSLPAIQAGFSVPALDAGASNEVYPLTGSDKWIRDLIGVIGGTLALIALLARGFIVARRRRRAPPPDYLDQALAPADYLTQAATPRGRMPRLRRGTAPPSRAGKIALLALVVGITGWAGARFAALLADVWPDAGWYWYVAVAAGIVIAVAPVWLLSRGTVWARAARGARGTARWPGWLLAGYTIAMVVGIKYYLSLRYTPAPSGVTVAPPSALFVFEMAGLAAETLIMAAITLLLLAVTAEIIAPGPVGRWLRSLRKQTTPPPRPAQGFANTPDREP
jgi:hypothetical protein